MGLLVLKRIIIRERFTYNKADKLKSRKLIEHLFNSGKSISVFPLKALYSYNEGGTAPLQAGVAVSSRNFKQAVKRNRVKRILREAYRLQKLPLQNSITSSGKPVVIFFIYLGKELPLFAEVYEKMAVLIDRISKNILSTEGKN